MRFRAAQERLLPGAPGGSGGSGAMWPKTSRDAAVIKHIALQKTTWSIRPEREISGMSLFVET